MSGMSASRIGPARSWGVGVHAARDRVGRSPSGGTRGVRMNATHGSAVTTVATVSATSDIGDNSSSSNAEEYKCNERQSNTHDGWGRRASAEENVLLKTLNVRKLGYVARCARAFMPIPEKRGRGPD